MVFCVHIQTTRMMFVSGVCYVSVKISHLNNKSLFLGPEIIFFLITLDIIDDCLKTVSAVI